MARIINSLVVLALASMFAGVSARRDLYDYCRDLSKMMADNLLIFTDAREAYKEASGHLRSIFNVGSDRWKLASAWKAVVMKEPCSEQSADHVWIILACEPNRDRELTTLDTGVKKYLKRCLTPKYWDKKLKQAIGSGDKTGLTKFIGDWFIKQYLKDNPEEGGIFFSSLEGPFCCDPFRSLEILIESVKMVPGNKNIIKLADPKSNKLDEILKERLFGPCRAYHSATSVLMSQAKTASSHYLAGEQAFIVRLSQDFQNAIFRYEYCTAILYSRAAQVS